MRTQCEQIEGGGPDVGYQGLAESQSGPPKLLQRASQPGRQRVNLARNHGPTHQPFKCRSQQCTLLGEITFNMQLLKTHDV